MRKSDGDWRFPPTMFISTGVFQQAPVSGCIGSNLGPSHSASATIASGSTTSTRPPRCGLTFAAYYSVETPQAGHSFRLDYQPPSRYSPEPCQN